MNNFKKQGMLFTIEDKEVNIFNSLFIGMKDLADKNDKEIIFNIYESLKENFSTKKYMHNLTPIFDFESYKGTSNVPKPWIFPVELFYDYKNKYDNELFNKYIVLPLKNNKPIVFPTTTLGAVTRGDDFFNYKEFIDGLWKSINKKNVILMAPRRYGKTSILYNLLDFPQSNYCPLYLDLEGISEAYSFVAEIILSLKRQAWVGECGKLKDFLGGSFENKTEVEISAYKNKLKHSIKENWQKKWEEFTQALNKSHLKILFLLDEFSYMLDNFSNQKKQSEAKELISFLHKTVISSKNSRFILTGSILVKRSLINLDYPDNKNFFSLFENKKLPCLSQEEGNRLVRILLIQKGIRPDNSYAEQILKLIGTPIPYFIQLFICEIEKGLLRERLPINKENLKMIYKTRLLGPDCKVYFKHYYDHLRNYTINGQYFFPAIKEIFFELALKEVFTQKELCKIFFKNVPRAKENDFSNFLDYLEDEFYLQKDKDKYLFANNLLKDWWLRHSNYLEISEERLA